MAEDQFIKVVQEVVGYLLGTCGAAAWASTFISDKRNGPVGKFLIGLMNVVGGNVGKARNDDASQ